MNKYIKILLSILLIFALQFSANAQTTQSTIGATGQGGGDNFNCDSVKSCTDTLFWGLRGNTGTVHTNNYIGTTDSMALTFRTYNDTKMKLFTSGELSISNAASEGALDYRGGFGLSLIYSEGSPFVGSSTADFLQSAFGTGLNSAAYHVFRRAGGTYSSPTAVPLNQHLSKIRIFGYGGNNYVLGAEINAVTDNTAGNIISDASMPTKIQFRTTPNNGFVTTIRQTIMANGFTAIGAHTPLSTLDVSGRMAWTVTTSTAAAITLDNTTTTLVLNLNGAQVVTLPAASTVTRAVYIITNPTATVKTISTYRNLTGANVTTIAANSAMWIQSNGSIWQRIF